MENKSTKPETSINHIFEIDTYDLLKQGTRKNKKKIKKSKNIEYNKRNRNDFL